MLLLGIWLFSLLNFSWWWFVGLFLVPDIGMIGYAINNKTGAFLYNLFHHKGIAIFLGLIGIFINSEWIELMGIIIFAHSSFDRMLGYGLKYEKGFKFTHLGEIGN